MLYTIFHHRAGALKGDVEADSPKQALMIRFKVADYAVKTCDDGTPVLRYGMRGEPEVIFHEYTAKPKGA
jgi:hypothetical protein